MGETININGTIVTDCMIKRSCTSAKIIGNPIEGIFKHLVQWFPSKGIKLPEPKAIEIANNYVTMSDPNIVKALAQEIEDYRTSDPFNKQFILYRESLEKREIELDELMQKLKTKLRELNKL